MAATIEDAYFGELQFDEEVRTWTGKYAIKGEQQFYIHFDGSSEKDQKIIEKARFLMPNLLQKESEIRNYVANQLLADKNESWLDENEDELDHEEFCRLLSVESINFSEDGSISIFYDDGNLFWGHVIIVSVDENGNPENAEIAG